jgi:cell division protein FtsW (lipid II flippase)
MSSEVSISFINATLRFGEYLTTRRRHAYPMLGALAVGGAFLALTPNGALGPWYIPVILACLAIAWVLTPSPEGERDDVLPALAVLAATLGLCLTARLSTDLVRHQEIWLAFSLGGMAIANRRFGQFRVLAGYKYIWVLASVLAFFALAVFGVEINGARLWLKFGPIQFEPIEVIKLFIVLFMGAYLAETADVIAAAPWWSFRSNLKHLGPLFLGWGASMSILIFQRDLGMAVLLLATFASMLYVATRRIDLIVAGFTIFGGVAAWAIHHYPYVYERIEVWQHPFAEPLGSGYQALQALFAIAAGGFMGTGYRLGQPMIIPEVATDYVYAAWSEEFGALGALLLLGLFLAIVLRILDIARHAPDLYAKLVATGLAATLGVQIIVIVGGVLGLFPLTGITLPFISYGGSSLVSNMFLISLAWSISRRPRRSRVLD